MTKSRGIRAPYHVWTKADERLLRRLYPDNPTAAIARRLGIAIGRVYAKANSLGLRKSAAFLASPAAHRLDGITGAGSRFKTGNVPWNKGRSYMPGGRVRDGWFKKGEWSKRWDPEVFTIGALRINSEGYLDIKVKEGSRSWRSLARFTWETERGPIPEGKAVRAINGDPDDTRIENLRLVSRVELMRENTIHNLPKPLADVIRLRGALNRRIRENEERLVSQHA